MRAIIITLAALGVAGCTVSSTASGTPSHPAATTTPASAPRAGATITLAGNSPGEKIAVTLLRVIARARPADPFSRPGRGHRLVAVQLRLTNAGTAAYSDSPGNGATVTDSHGQSYDAGLASVRGCQSFPGTERIAPGSSGLGCVVFEVPAGARIKLVQFGLDSGFASETARWAV